MNPGVHPMAIEEIKKQRPESRCPAAACKLTIIFVVEFFGVSLHFLYVLICLALSLFQVNLFYNVTDLWVVHQKRENCFSFWVLQRHLVDEIVDHHKTED